MTDAVEFHDRIATSFRDKYLSDPGFVSRLEIWRTLIGSHAKPGGRSMDLGCGPGWMTEALCKRSARVVAIDGSKAMIELAHERTRATSSTVEFFHESVTPMSMRRWPAESFDTIVASSALEYIRDAKAVIAELGTLLCKGGVLAFSVPNAQSWYRRLESAVFSVTGKPAYRQHVVNLWTPDETKGAVSGAGLRVEQMMFEGRVPYYSTLFFWLPDRHQHPLTIVIARK